MFEGALEKGYQGSRKPADYKGFFVVVNPFIYKSLETIAIGNAIENILK